MNTTFRFLFFLPQRRHYSNSIDRDYKAERWRFCVRDQEHVLFVTTTLSKLFYRTLPLPLDTFSTPGIAIQHSYNFQNAARQQAEHPTGAQMCHVPIGPEEA
jgi:hypothetical protein